MAALLLFVLIAIANLPIAGTTLALLMFCALLSRTAFQWVAFVTLKSSPNRRGMALSAAVWSIMTSAFFLFVILYQFGIRA